MEEMLQRKIDKSRITNYWNTRAESFMKQREQELQSEQHRIWRKELLSHLSGEKPLRILDVGCGCGFFSLILAQQGHKVTGIDLTQSMIFYGKQLAKRFGVKLDLQIMDAESPDFSDGTFDLVVSRNLTWTLPNPAHAYQQWLRILKPGGMILNYDAEHARYHRKNGLEQEEAHKMLSKEQIKENMKIYSLLPISEWKRPEWDVFVLKQAGCNMVETDLEIGKRLYPKNDQFCTPYPVFRIKAVKERNK